MADLLAPYAPLLSDGFAPVARDVLAWARLHTPAIDAAQAAKLAAVATVYTCLTGPTQPPAHGQRAVSTFVYLFFLTDDTVARSLAADVMPAWEAELAPLFPATPALHARRRASFRDYLDVLAAEAAGKGRTLGLDEHWALRRRTIFTEPYLDVWMTVAGLDPTVADTAAFVHARALATDLTLLSNDLGSAARDRADGDAPDDLNLIDTYVAVHGWTRAHALAELVAMHGELITRFRAARARALAEVPAAEAYAELLTNLVDGNLGALRRLQFRYPGVGALLDQLATT